MRETNNSINESVEASSEEFVISLNILQLQYNIFIVTYVTATVQVLYHLGLFDRFEIKDEVFKPIITFNTG